MMIKKYLYYGFFVLRWNLALSLIVTTSFLFYMSSMGDINLKKAIQVFSISFLSGGYLFGTFLFQAFRKKEFYFFHNLCVSKLRLVAVTYIMHFLIVILLILLISYAKFI
jgi:hypothetical protein